MTKEPAGRIIIIEDDDGVAALQRRRLERAGYEVRTFSAPEEAVPIIERGETDLMILDYRLPDQRTGLDFYEELKRSGHDVPAILVTGFTNEALIVKALRAGMRDFVSKSVEYLEYLPEAVGQVLQQTRMERRLAETEARFETVFRASPIAIAVATYDEGRFVDVNDAFVRMVGFSREELLGHSALELGLVGPQFDREKLLADLRERGSLHDRPYELHTKDGRRIDAEISLEVIKFHGQRCLLSMMHDVSERLRTEAALRESENRFQAFMSHSPAVAFLKDEHGTYVYVNQSMLCAFHTELSTWVGHTDAEIFPPEIAAEFRRTDRIVLEQGCKLETEDVVPVVNGERHTWLTLKFPVSDGSGRNFVGGLTIDISERKRAQQQLELRERAMNATSEGIIIADASGDYPVVYVNKTFEELTGYAASEVIGRNCRFLQGPETDKATVAEIRAALAEGRSVTAELLNYRKDGRTFWNLLSITPVRDSEKRITHFVGVQRDITERKLIAEQMRQSQKMEAIGRLAGGIAHDFNNILTIILGNAELAIEDMDKDDPRRVLMNEVVHAGQRAASLTGQLLAFSRRQVLEPKIVDLNALVVEAERLLRRLIGEDILLTTSLAPGLRKVKVDPVQIEQILLNLTVNARDAMPEGGRLTIETANVDLDASQALTGHVARPGPYVMMAVTDTGQGMDDATKGRIFEPFFTTKERGRGTGMGLSTVYGIVQQSGGYIWVYSEKGRGTTFKIYLPQHGGDAAALPPRPSRTAIRGTETLLLVEDETMVRALARRMLEQDGYTVLEARNGSEALRVAGAFPEHIHLLITDVIMPGMSGRQLAQELAKVRPSTRVLYVSGYTDNTISERGVLDANVAFLQKPFSHEALASKVRQVLDGAASNVGGHSPRSAPHAPPPRLPR